MKIIVDNPSGLPLLPLDEFVTFQGDLKKTDEAKLEKLCRSIIDHHVFIAKAVFFEDGKAYTEDGHQTLLALKRLRDNGYTQSEVVSYAMVDGRMQPTERVVMDGINVPFQAIVPVGDTPAKRMKDAASKLLQINSQYAKINPETSLFQDLAFELNELDDLLGKISIEGFDLDFGKSGDPGMQSEMEQYNDENCLYPIVPQSGGSATWGQRPWASGSC